MTIAPYNLTQDSLNGGSLQVSVLQSTAIYWESWQTPFRGIFGSLYGAKWSWTALDQHIRRLLSLDSAFSSRGALAYFSTGCIDNLPVRKSEVAADFGCITFGRNRSSFSFFPAGLGII